MYGILVDNAIEAAEKTDNKVVDIYLDQKEKCNTTKGEKGHGIGLHKLQSMIYKRKGTIDAYYDTKENKFHIKIQHM